MVKSILITKPAAEVRLLEDFCIQHGIRLIAHSFIRFAPVKAVIPQAMEVLFFGSRRAAEFFLKQASIPENCQVACIGMTTKKHLEALGLEVAFFGSQAGDPQAVAIELKIWLGNRQLHVALSAQSNRSMSSVLPTKQVKELIVYETISAPKHLDELPEVIAFTSPSNLEGFLMQNSIVPGTQLIAWGKTTEKVLNLKGFDATQVLENSTEEELIALLEKSFL